jgi:RHS repeat-associated protein
VEVNCTTVVRCASGLSRSTGKERDTETGLDYFGARYFGSNMGRFLSPDEFPGGPVDLFDEDDPASQALPYADITNPQSLSKYTYTYNNPLRYTDPDGHIALADDVVIGIAVSAIVVSAWMKSPQGQETIRQSVEAAKSIGSAILSKVKSFDVGTYGDLKGQSLPGDNIDIHHVPQAGQAGQLIPNYDPKTAPGIAIPKDQHKDIPTERGEAKRNPRDQVAKDVKDLRKHTDAPRGQIQKLVDKVKKTYPDSMKKPDKKTDGK